MRDLSHLAYAHGGLFATAHRVSLRRAAVLVTLSSPGLRPDKQDVGQPGTSGDALMPMRSENLRGIAFMMTAMAAFTVSDACVKHLATVLPLFQVITLRGILTLVLMVAIARMSGGLQLGAVWRVRRLVGMRALAEVGSTVTFFAALLHLPFATLSAILQSLPLAITLCAALFLGEKVGWRRMGAILVGFVGVIVIIRPGAESFNTWSLMALLSVAIVVVRDLASRRLPPDVPSVTVALIGAMGVTVLSAVLSAATPWQPIPLREGALILLASGAVVVGYIFIVRVMRVGEVGVTVPFRYTSLIWAALIGWLFFAEVPDLWTVAGGVLVVGSGLFTLARERRLARLAAEGRGR
jgi:drug/metabolite transporter (DMT)-like permease